MQLDGEDIVVGQEWPESRIFWDTGDGRPAGCHRAILLSIRPYTGRYPQFFSHIVRLSAPSVSRGWMEMTTQIDT